MSILLLLDEKTCHKLAILYYISAYQYDIYILVLHTRQFIKYHPFPNTSLEITKNVLNSVLKESFFLLRWGSLSYIMKSVYLFDVNSIIMTVVFSIYRCIGSSSFCVYFLKSSLLVRRYMIVGSLKMRQPRKYLKRRINLNL